MNISLLYLSAILMAALNLVHSRKACQLDVAIWFDNSEFLFPGTKSRIAHTKAMVAKIIIAVGVSEEGTHIALGGISEHPQVFMPFSGNQSGSHIRNVLRRVTVRPQEHNRFDKAFLMAKRMFTEARGGRTNAKKILIVLTNGIAARITNDVPEMGEVAHEVREEGVEVFVIGLGSDVDILNLLSMVSYDAERVHRKISEEFLSQLQKVKREACEWRDPLMI